MGEKDDAMTDKPDGRRCGRFLIEPGREIHGELASDGRETSLRLQDSEVFDTLSLDEGSHLTGTLYDHHLTKVSLFNCFTTQGCGSGKAYGEEFHFSTVLPSFVLEGRRHL